MARKRIRVSEWLYPVLFWMLILWGVDSGQAQTIGKTIDKTNYKEYEALLIPPMLEGVKKGDYIYRTGNLDFPWKQEDMFLRASQKNADKFDTEKGWVVDKKTRKQLDFIFGLPFLKVDPKDPNVAEKLMWNQKFQVYRYGSLQSLGSVTRFVGRSGFERSLTAKGYEFCYQGRYGDPIKKNPDNVLYLYMSPVVEPFDLRGNVSMTWEYYDDRSSTVFSYIPVIRRIRRMSGAARSDPFMGSDAWIDGINGWGGKNSTMKFKLLGERMVLAMFVTTKKGVAEEAPDGTMTVPWTYDKYGFETPGWTGTPWANPNAIYVPRRVWIIEGTPIDPYYNYGKHIFYQDQETYEIWYKEVFDKSGKFWNWQWRAVEYFEAPSGKNTVGFNMEYCSVDVRADHATPSSAAGSVYHMPVSKMGPHKFTLDVMLKLGSK